MITRKESSPFTSDLVVDHIGVVVPNIGTATAFYRDTLKCKISDPVLVSDHDIHVVFVEMANCRIELISPLGRIDPPRTLLEQYTSVDFLSRTPAGGIHHVCYLVPDLEAFLRKLAVQGVFPLGNGKPVVGASGRQIIFLNPETTGGTLIELKQSA